MNKHPAPAAKPGLRRVRSASDIRGASSITRADTPAHQLYMRLCTLEMERHRLQQERSEALERVQRTEHRIAQIDAETRQFQAKIAEKTNARGPHAAIESKPERHEAVGFTFEY
jgi:chromosome segregation ATPase